MKYEVIGWTYVGTEEYPEHEHITCCVDNAIIKEIRKHGYMFGGDRHEDYCPVLNDGTYVSYSWRGWGRIMAIAHEENNDDGLAYALYYMDCKIDPECRKYPKDGSIDKKRIRPKETLTETFTMHLSNEMFEAVKEGDKTVEVRLFDDKRKLVDIGDYIEFRKKGDDDERVLRRVSDIKIDKTFRGLLEHNVHLGNKDWEMQLRFPPKQLGASEDSDINSLVEGMYKYYTKKQEKKFGAIAFTLGKVESKHLCTTYLSIGYDYDTEYNNAFLLDEFAAAIKKMEKFDEVIGEWNEIGGKRKAEIENIIKGEFDVTPELRYNNFIIGSNEAYNVDVNEMLRVTLKGFLGKEAKLRELSEKYLLTITLQIVPQISAESDEPKQCLSLERDIIEFLHKSGAVMDLDYYLV